MQFTLNRMGDGDNKFECSVNYLSDMFVKINLTFKIFVFIIEFPARLFLFLKTEIKNYI